MTTAPDMLYLTSPSPPGGAVVTCALDPPLTINLPDSVTLTLSFSINNSFEWVEHSNPNIFEPFEGDTIYDVGIRGLKVTRN